MSRTSRIIVSTSAAVIVLSATYLMIPVVEAPGTPAGPRPLRPRIEVTPLLSARAAGLDQAAGAEAASVFLAAAVERAEQASLDARVARLAGGAGPASGPPSATINSAGDARTAEAIDDSTVRRLIAGLSSHPQLVVWMLHEGLMRRFVNAVEDVAEGYSPSERLGFLRPNHPFLVQRREGRLVAAPSSFRRYDLLAEVFASIDAAGAVALYHRLEPTLTRIHHEVAPAHYQLDERLLAAIDHLLAVEIPAQAPELEQHVLGYAFAEPELERLSDAQRHLLRMGPANARRIQSKLRELRQALDPDLRIAAAGTGAAAVVESPEQLPAERLPTEGLPAKELPTGAPKTSSGWRASLPGPALDEPLACSSTAAPPVLGL